MMRHSPKVTLLTLIMLGSACATTRPSREAPISADDAAKPRLQLQSGHTGAIMVLAFSPDGRTLASGAGDSRVKLWDIASGQEIGALVGHLGFVDAIAYTKDGQRLVSGSWDHTVRVWDVRTETLLYTLSGTHIVSSVAVSPDGRVGASGSWETVRLWNLSRGEARHVLAGHSGSVDVVAFSPDGGRLASADDEAVRVWDVETGALLHTLSAEEPGRTAAMAFEADGQTLVTVDQHDVVIRWDLRDGRAVAAPPEGPGRPTDPTRGSSLAVLALDANRLGVAAFGDPVIVAWDLGANRQLGTFELPSRAFDRDPEDVARVRRLFGASRGPGAVAFDRAGRRLAAADGQTIKIWDVDSGEQLSMLTKRTEPSRQVARSPDGRWIAAARTRGNVKLWDTSTGRELRTIEDNGATLLTFGADSRWLATSADEAFRFWDPLTGEALQTLPGGIAAAQVGFVSPEGRWLLLKTDAGLTLWDAQGGRPAGAVAAAVVTELRRSRADASRDGGWLTEPLAASPDGRWLLVRRSVVNRSLDPRSPSEDTSEAPEEKPDQLVALEMATARAVLLRGTPPRRRNMHLAFSPDGDTIVVGDAGGGLTFWETATGRQLRSVRAHEGDSMTGTSFIYGLAFSPDGRLLATAGGDKRVRLWDAATGEARGALEGHEGWVGAVAFFGPGGRWLLSAGGDATVRVWDVATRAELVKMVALDDEDWAVVDPHGRFDASAGGMRLMHWKVGAELIALEQLKERYFEPGLLAKVLGHDAQPLRDVGAFGNVRLFPEVTYVGEAGADGKVRVEVRNRGGGIGRIQVFVNGKELAHDARGADLDPGAARATLTIDLARAHVVPGADNEIRVVAWNEEGYLAGRGVRATWRSPARPEDQPPELYAIVVGVSEYAAPGLRLSFAAKDAEDIARGLELAGGRLFGAERMHVALLTTSGGRGVAAPTKGNVRRAFEAARAARPGDVLVVYLAGHGATVHDLYAFPTQEAGSLDLADPAVRAATAITSEELVTWIKEIPALHQAMILDTCAAGAAAKRLVDKRAVSGDQIRAIERLKDRTGFFVLMGAAADAVSYEASRYGQGLLTYALLQGMRGAALKDDVNVDVSRLFQYAADHVPELARDIGGIQRPVVAAPDAGSFPIGQLLLQDREGIPLSMVKPLVLGPALTNRERDWDDLELARALRGRLREASFVSSRGAMSMGDDMATSQRAEAPQPAIVFVDAEGLPGAFRPEGSYTVSGTTVSVRLKLIRDRQEIASIELEGDTGDIPGLIDAIVAALVAQLTSADFIGGDANAP